MGSVVRKPSAPPENRLTKQMFERTGAPAGVVWQRDRGAERHTAIMLARLELTLDSDRRPRSADETASKYKYCKLLPGPHPNTRSILTGPI